MGDPEFWLSENMDKTFGLPEEAREWLLMLWNSIQVLDDVADGDAVERDALDAAICDMLVNMPASPFFQKHHHILLPLLSVAILKWKAADTVERARNVSPTSFVWRAGYYDLVLAVVQICHGEKVALNICHDVLKLYGEDYDDYAKEFG